MRATGGGSWNEWAPLKAVVVGTIKDYSAPIWSWDMSPGFENRLEQASAISSSCLPQWYVEEVEEDLDQFAELLRLAEVEVHRPVVTDVICPAITENHMSLGADFYNMRDMQFVYGRTLIGCQPSNPARVSELSRLRQFFRQICNRYELSHIEFDIPALPSDPKRPFVKDGNCLHEYEERLHKALGGLAEDVWHRLDESEPLFDAANLIRMNDTILYLVSSTGNHQAVESLRRALGPSVTVEVTEAYRSSHLDSTILPIREDLVLVNSARVSPANLPKSLEGREVIYFDQVAPLPQREVEFHESVRLEAAKSLEDLGFSSVLSEISSPWAGLNVLSVSPDVVFVESRQARLASELSSRGMAVQMVDFRHPYTMLGGLHCTTLDLWRGQ